jgi:tRNA-binding protein
MVTIDDFHKLDIRAGRIVDVADFPEARKPSYILTIDFGGEVGLKKSSAQLVANYKKEQLKGRMILGVVNFPPRQIGKFRSEVLTLGVPDESGNCILIEPDIDTSIVKEGARLY